MLNTSYLCCGSKRYKFLNWIRTTQPALPMRLPATQVWPRKTLAVEFLALDFMRVVKQFLCWLDQSIYNLHEYLVHCTCFLQDMMWTGEVDIEDDPRLEKLQQIYLKNREPRLRNVAFDANATEGGENKPTSPLTLSFQSGFCRTTSKLWWLVSGAPRTTRLSTTSPSPWRAPLASLEEPWACSQDFPSSVVLRLSITLQST